LSLNGVNAGSYRLYAVMKPTDSQTWQPVKTNSLLNNYLTVSINTSRTATLTRPPFSPLLQLTEKPVCPDTLYQQETASFQLTLSNSGTEFYSFLSLLLQSADQPCLSQEILYGPVTIPTDSLVTLVFSSTISLNPGSYTVQARYDSTNLFSKQHFKSIQSDPAQTNPLTVYVASRHSSNPITLASQTVGRVWLNTDQALLVIESDQPVLEASLYDPSGRLVVRTGQANKLSVSGLPKGVYLLTYRTASGFHVQKTALTF
jgi:hypothetical protein